MASKRRYTLKRPRDCDAWVVEYPTQRIKLVSLSPTHHRHWVAFQFLNFEPLFHPLL